MTARAEARPDLFLLSSDFEDPAYPDELFFCRHGALVEGVLTLYPALRKRLNLHRVPFERPREAVIVLAGEDNQTVPRLVLPPGVTSGPVTTTHLGRQSIAGAEAIIVALRDLYGIAPPHP
jgi:hypothetical protein